jgi:hypothetical protein
VGRRFLDSSLIANSPSARGELQGEITAAYRDAITTDEPEDLRRAEAAERLLSRVYGRPTERVENVAVGEPETVQELRRMRLIVSTT